MTPSKLKREEKKARGSILAFNVYGLAQVRSKIYFVKLATEIIDKKIPWRNLYRLSIKNFRYTAKRFHTIQQISGVHNIN